MVKGRVNLFELAARHGANKKLLLFDVLDHIVWNAFSEILVAGWLSNL